MKARKRFEHKFPRFESIRMHPEVRRHTWLVKLQDSEKEHEVGFGSLRNWLVLYAGERVEDIKLAR